VHGLALHPSRKYAVSVSDDASWAWWDLNNAACLKQVRGCFKHCYKAVTKLSNNSVRGDQMPQASMRSV
jgi:hypothetical protein